MARSQPRTKARTRRGTLARPLDALVFLLPLIVFYEVASLARQDRVIAFDFLRRFFELFGQVGMWAPGLAVIVILLATHVAAGDKWVVHWNRVGWMYVESVALSVPLLLLNWAVPLVSTTGNSSSLLDRLALGIGAGVYEELVFRLILISVVVMIGVDLLRRDRAPVAVAAVILSSLAFAAHHHRPIGAEPFELVRFLFRTMAGVYLAAIFWFRGYGPAAGCHAAYNVALVLLRWLTA
ncbi:MAG: CPBP family intramembrane glutamic endopeptidase [Planctomycetota bacterium]